MESADKKLSGRLPAEDFPAAHRCPVCSGSIVLSFQVTCASCQTPHHRDCFEYFGTCGVFGCGQSRLVDGNGQVVVVPTPVRLDPSPSSELSEPMIQASETTGDLSLNSGPLPTLWAQTRIRQSARALTHGGAVFGIVSFGLAILMGDVFGTASGLVACLAVGGAVTAGAAGGALTCADGSRWELDPDRHEIRLIGRVFGVELSRARILASEVRALDLHEPLGPGGGSMWLTLVTRSGHRHWLAREGAWLLSHYSEAEMVRVGNAWARALGVPFLHTYPKEVHGDLPPVD